MFHDSISFNFSVSTQLFLSFSSIQRLFRICFPALSLQKLIILIKFKLVHVVAKLFSCN